jgi:PhoH-like ATPase
LFVHARQSPSRGRNLFENEILMPLPKLPSKPATLLLAKDYPKASGANPVPFPNEEKAAPAPKKAAPKTAAKAVKETVAAKTAAKKTPALKAVKLPDDVPAPPRTKAAPQARAKVTPIKADAPHPAKHKAHEVVLKSASSRKADVVGSTKLFVLDTNVLMHDPSSLFRFEEHDVFLPMMTLEELDNHKKGMSEVARNARQVSRTLDALVSNTDDDQMETGIPLNKLGNKDAKGHLFFQTRALVADLPEGLPQGKADNQILAVVRSLEAEQSGRAVVLVSKDINMRIKARAMGLPAEDYFNDHVLEDTDLLYSGIVQLPDDFWNKHGKDMESWQENKHGQSSTFYRVTGPFIPSLLVNQFVYL